MNLAAVRRFALALPETTEAPHFEYTSFRVKGRIFATAPPEGGRLHLFVAPPVRISALSEQPGCLEPLMWGKRVVGLRVALEAAPASLVKLLVRQAWMNKAPKRLVETGSKPAQPRPRSRKKR